MKVADTGRCKGAFHAGRRAAFGRVVCSVCGARFRPMPGLRVPNHVSQRDAKPDPTKPDPTKPDPTLPDSTEPESPQLDPAEAEPATPGGLARGGPPRASRK